MESVIKTFKLVVHENLGLVIINCKYKNRILAAYASHKYTMKKKNKSLFYIAQSIQNIYTITEKSLMNHFIITFKAFLISMNFFDCLQKNIVVFIDDLIAHTEIECRRYIESHNSVLQNILGISCNDLSNMKFLKRNIEIVINHNNSNINNNKEEEDEEEEEITSIQYRCYINNDEGFSMQLKHYYDKKETFVDEINSFELLHYSKESAVFDKSHYFLIHSKMKTIIGLASFLDCNNVSVKTLYLDDNEGTVLYQRIILDDYKNQQPFILEHEFSSTTVINETSLKRYFDLSCLLNAKLPNNPNLIKNGYSNSSSKPIQINDYDYDDNNSKKYFFFKLDGVLATLKFYNSHFVVSNNLKSESFPHSLPKEIIHRLKDFSFMVESELYDSIFSSFDKPKPMAIIDLHTSSFSAIERMDIIQKIKKEMAKPLQEYFIFFQGEQLFNNNNNNNNIFYPNKSINYLNSRLIEYLKKNFIVFIKSNNNNSQLNNFELKHGKIYEVYINKQYKIESILKPRNDKIFPNSRKCVDYVVHH